MTADTALAPRGMPLAMMGLVLAAWIAGRTLLWESPFPLAGPPTAPVPAAAPIADAVPAAAPQAAAPLRKREAARRLPPRGERVPALSGDGFAPATDPQLAAAHRHLLRAAMRLQLSAAPPGGRMARSEATAARQDGALFLPPPSGSPGRRLSLDAWAFARQGSDAAPVSEGRVPIYGASQAGAVLQYRLAPATRRDPRLYARAYRALVRRGESELALGASARPLPQVPARLQGEVRFTDGAFRSERRLSAFAVTEIAPIALPLGARLETYAQGGWVGGADDTLFADGQASITREIAAVARMTDNAVRVSIGAGAWGGAQEGAHRVDLGPTLRLDMRLGAVPARLSLDWRERVEGEAGPDTGLALTLSTGF